RVIVLEKGNLAFNGNPDDAIAYYLEQEEKKKSKLKEKSVKTKPMKPFYGDLFHNEEKIYNVKYKLNKDTYAIGDEVILSFSFELSYKPKKLIIGMPIWIESEGKFITSFTSDYDGTLPYINGNKCVGELKFICHFNPEKYFTTFNVRDGSEFLHRQIASSFLVQNKIRTYGYVTLNRKWSFK
ncbi:MAG: hypothetical protein KAH72_05265, partial [Flavobacteriaceae bacterium]|nr:hypothetical protein [Flavobacteriaceae bacterium]